MQVSNIAFIISTFSPVLRTESFAVAAQTSAQSEQDRMH
jgi:hypothetical protein